MNDSDFQKNLTLTYKRLTSNLTPGKGVFTPEVLAKRPVDSLIGLVSWVKSSLKIESHSCYLHNKFNLDGSFLYFCEEAGATVECILKDSIASWKTADDNEHFACQGIFKITKGKLSFYHCSLFHKGNQNEDEVSFFNLTSNANYSKYIDFRNEYDDWSLEQEKASNSIYVVGSDPISFDHCSWKDLIVPKDLETEIRNSVEGFLNSEDFYKKHKIPWKRSMIFFGPPGCGKTLGIKIILSEYGFKPVTIQPGHPQVEELLDEAFDYAQSHGPSLLFLEDFPELLQGVNESHFLQLLDGIKSNQGLLVIATANDLSKIPPSITDRPSRFDRKISFPFPDKKMALKFLKSNFGKSLTGPQYTKVVAKAVANEFSFAYLKELWVGSIHLAILDGRSKCNFKDVESTLETLCKDKSYVKTGFGLSNARPMDITSLFED